MPCNFIDSISTLNPVNFPSIPLIIHVQSAPNAWPIRPNLRAVEPFLVT